MLHSTIRLRAFGLIAALMVSALAGCLGEVGTDEADGDGGGASSDASSGSYGNGPGSGTPSGGGGVTGGGSNGSGGGGGSGGVVSGGGGSGGFGNGGSGAGGSGGSGEGGSGAGGSGGSGEGGSGAGGSGGSGNGGSGAGGSGGFGAGGSGGFGAGGSGGSGNGGSGAGGSGGSGNGGDGPGGSGGSGGDGSVQQLCVDTINQYRATLGLPPLMRWFEAEACSDEEAESDGNTGQAHGAFGLCNERAQNECPGWRGPAESMIGSCLKMMWDEGPGEDFSKHGHYLNMSNTSFTKVACGFHTFPDGKVWAVQNFR